MNPRDWRLSKKLTLQQVASLLTDVTGQKINLHRVHRIELGQLPEREIAAAYLHLSEGAVTPNDFYGLASADRAIPHPQAEAAPAGAGTPPAGAPGTRVDDGRSTPAGAPGNETEEGRAA